MNLETASRLVALRKENNLSQEALAEKLGISRQAVSKWERAEASPDTDNLIALARLYHVSLDELLQIHEEESGESVQDVVWTDTRQGHDGWQTETNGTENGEAGTQDGVDDEEDVHIGFDGIHVKDKSSEVHISWSGIHVVDKDKDNEVHIDKNGIRVIGDDAENHIFTCEKGVELPLCMIAIVIYIIIGCMYDVWHPGWLIFFLVPIISTFICAVRKRNANYFAYPVLVILIFLFSGLVNHVWHPAWAVFLTIPLYYSLVGYIRQWRKSGAENEAD